jgi:hypothetical protein
MKFVQRKEQNWKKGGEEERERERKKERKKQSTYL